MMIKFIFEIIRPFRFWIYVQIIISTIWSFDLSFRPYLLKIMIDRLQHFNQHSSELSDIQNVYTPMALYLLMSLLMVIVFRLYDYFELKVNSPLKSHIVKVLMGKMMNHSISMFQNNFSGSLTNKIKDVMKGIPDLLKLVIQQLFGIFLALIIAIYTLSTINLKFGIILFSWVIVYVVGALLFSVKAKDLSFKVAELQSNVIGHLVDILSNIFNVHLFAAKQNELKTLDYQLKKYVIAYQKKDWWYLYLFSFQGLSFIIYQVILFAYLISDFKLGLVTVGDFALIISLNISLIEALWALSSHILAFSENIGDISQGLAIPLALVDIQDKPNASTLNCVEGEIIFDKVNFHYQGMDALFQDKSIKIEAGQKVGLVGFSGSGKSTFINLLLRIYDVLDGAIYIDQQNISQVTQDSLRASVAVIPQDPSLFHRSILENIRYGRASATDEEIVKAAKAAFADEFITKIPEGYNAEVGERGVKLSGGQRQRIAIARAILKNSPILILDEATSQLDSITEKLIQDSLTHLMQDKTTIIIAHRLSTLMGMDRILVFDHGKIVEDGHHLELLKINGVYKQLWDAQVGGFIGDLIV